MKTLTVLTIIIASVFMIAPVFGQVYPDGMVSYWKFDEGSGTIATDSVGTNDGTLTTGPVWSSGQVDGALSFDGIDDRITIPDSESFNLGADDFTIETWFKSDYQGPFYEHMFGQMNSSGSVPSRSFYMQILRLASAPIDGTLRASIVSGSTEYNVESDFAVNDGVAIGALRAIREAELKVPDNIAVIGYDNDEIAPFASVPLTTVVQRKKEMGKIAVRLLLERIRQKREMSRHILLEPTLVIRASCGAESFTQNSVNSSLIKE